MSGHQRFEGSSTESQDEESKGSLPKMIPCLALGGLALLGLGIAIGSALPRSWSGGAGTAPGTADKPTPMTMVAPVTKDAVIVDNTDLAVLAAHTDFCQVNASGTGAQCDGEEDVVRCCAGSFKKKYACGVIDCEGYGCSDGHCEWPTNDTVKTEDTCHTAKQGEECYDAVIDAMASGMQADYPGLSANSTFADFQRVMSLDHVKYPGNCPMPCIVLLASVPEDTLVEVESVAFCKQMGGWGTWCSHGHSIKCCGGNSNGYECGRVACAGNRCTGNGICGSSGSGGGDLACRRRRDCGPVNCRRRRECSIVNCRRRRDCR